jgi:hypothetical protein
LEQAKLIYHIFRSDVKPAAENDAPKNAVLFLRKSDAMPSSVVNRIGLEETGLPIIQGEVCLHRSSSVAPATTA